MPVKPVTDLSSHKCNTSRPTIKSSCITLIFCDAFKNTISIGPETSRDIQRRVEKNAGVPCHWWQRLRCPSAVLKGDGHFPRTRFPPDVSPAWTFPPYLHTRTFPPKAKQQNHRRFFTLSLSRNSLQRLTQLNFCDRRRWVYFKPMQLSRTWHFCGGLFMQYAHHVDGIINYRSADEWQNDAHCQQKSGYCK